MMIVSKNYGDDAMNLKKTTAALLCMLMLSACGKEVKSEGADRCLNRCRNHIGSDRS